MTQPTSTPKRRRMAREPQTNIAETPGTSPHVEVSAEQQPAPPRQPTRLDQLEALLTRAEGATIADMVDATGWQQHSVRGAMAGALKKRGLVINSSKDDGLRRYHAARPA